jgi:hypothetical protein
MFSVYLICLLGAIALGEKGKALPNIYCESVCAEIVLRRTNNILMVSIDSFRFVKFQCKK